MARPEHDSKTPSNTNHSTTIPGNSSWRNERLLANSTMAPRNKSNNMPPNRINDNSTSEDASLHQETDQNANPLEQEDAEMTHQQAWAQAEGYTPLVDASRNGGAIFMAFNPNDDEGGGQSFFANAGAYASASGENEWGEQENEVEEEEEEGDVQYNTDFRFVADQALQALEDEYSITVKGTLDPLSTESDDAKPAAAAFVSKSTFATDDVADRTSLFKQQDSVQKELPSIDTDAVRKAVNAIRLKDPRLTAEFSKWEETQLANTTIPPKTHSIIPDKRLSSFSKDLPAAINATANLSRAATLAEAIDRLHLLDSGKEELVIHIAGADHVECSSNEQLVTLFGPLIRWLGAKSTSPQHVKIHLIGPNVPKDASARPAVNLLSPATNRMISATATCHEGTYHKWQQQDVTNDFVPPDIAIAFNAGIWGYNEWLPTIEALAESSFSRPIPFVSTAYTIQECQDDAEVIESVVAKGGTGSCLWKPEANPFGSRKIRETATAVPGREYRENAAWQAWSLGGTE